MNVTILNTPDVNVSRVLWQPMSIGTLEVSGRIFKTATHETLASDKGFVTSGILDFYRPMAESGLPLIITGNIFVSWQGKSGGRQLALDDDDKIAGMKILADMCHQYGTRLFAQLNHGGSQMRTPAEGIADLPVTSTGRLHPTLLSLSRSLREDEFPRLIKSFADAAERAKKAGCDGVQIQMGHGYLISQFLTPGTNRRTDRYGGNAEKRIALALEVYRAVRERVGGDFPVIAKLNGRDDRPGGVALEHQLELAKKLEEEGLDAIEITRGHFSTIPSTLSGQWSGFLKRQVTVGMAASFPIWQRWFMRLVGVFMEPFLNRFYPRKQGFNIDEAQHFTRVLDIPVISCGGFNDKQAMESVIKSGKVAAISMGRGLIANPYFYQHVYNPIADAPVCSYCNKCIGSAGGELGVGCFDLEVKEKQVAMLESALSRRESTDF
ncbi:NADH:flavin oxidoreductase [Pseudomonas piscis]|nr:NADH:flavin oxidoreductase [Pseudomonas piscis]